MYVVALITAGEVPARYRGVWCVSDIGEDTFGYRVHSTLSTGLFVMIVPGQFSFIPIKVGPYR